MLLPPLTAIVTERACAVVRLVNDGITLTVGVFGVVDDVIAPGEELPPHPCRGNTQPIRMTRATCTNRERPRLVMSRTVCDAVSFSKVKRSGRRRVVPIVAGVVN